MTLKEATNLAVIGTITEFIWTIAYYTINYFELIEYSTTKWFYQIWIIPNSFFLISLLIFFITLSKKQKGSSNV